MSTPPERIAGIRARLQAATPGPWEIWSGNPWHAEAPNHRLRREGENAPVVFQTGMSGSGFFYREGAQEQAQVDADFIANAPGDIQFLLDLVGVRGASPAPSDAIVAWVNAIPRQFFEDLWYEVSVGDREGRKWLTEDGADQMRVALLRKALGSSGLGVGG